MLDTTEDLLLVLLMVGISLLFMVALGRLWPWEKRRPHNELIGWQFSILGTTNAVILGFMLYAVWNDYGAAEINADFEANALVNVERLCDGLPLAQQATLKALARTYAGTVLEKDWPEMAHNQATDESSAINQKMWNTLMSVRAVSPSEITAQDHAITELSSMTEHRRTRLLQSASRLPPVLWWVLIIGGLVTVGSSSMFGSANSWLHAIQVFTLSLLVALALVSIGAIDRPFQGSVHVSDDAFRRAQRSMNHQ